MSQASRKRRSSLFGINPKTAKSEKLNEEIGLYLEFLEKLKHDKDVSSAESIKPSKLSTPSKKTQDFLNTLPGIEHYVTVATDFLKKHEVTIQEQQKLQRELSESVSNLI